MLDDLRNSASTPLEPDPEQSAASIPVRPPSPKQFLGMSAAQRFVIMLMLFMMTCVLGAGCLVLTGKVYLPFF